MIARLVLSGVLFVGLAGCFRSNGEFRCESDAECVRGGTTGTCELVGFCSFPDSACASGTRFGDYAGSLSNQCVGDTPPGDAGVDTPVITDGSPDAPPIVPPVFLVAANAHGDGVASLTYALDIPASNDRFLVVSIQLGSECTTASSTVLSVTYNGAAATRIDSILGTPCGAGTTRSEQWGLVAPDVGNHMVVVTLSGPNGGAKMYSVHSGALAFSGVDQTSPVRASATASGDSVTSTVTVASDPDDLVVNTVGQGDSIAAPGNNQTLRFIENTSSGDTLDNAGASTAPGAATVDMTWTFGDPDQWQSISTSLRPTNP